MSLSPTAWSRAALLSAVVVLAPAAGGAAALATGVGTVERAATERDAAGVLLGLAAVALAVVLAWATAAALAGVLDAWARATGGTAQPDPHARVVSAGAPPRGRTGAVSAGVAALVLAALAAPAATAGTAGTGHGLPTRATAVHLLDDAQPSSDRSGTSPGAPAPVPSTTADGATTTATTTTTTVATTAATTGTATATGTATGAGAGPVVEDATDQPPPGSWAALAEVTPTDDGFRAPRGASLGSAALVTSQPSRPPVSYAAADVVVLAGDSLWSIAARHLGPEADDAEIAQAWPQWWKANRAVVGEDPDLLLPGQRLVAPGP